ncbi:hypothetical protein ASPVEDRAFT_125467 [Aspergillus versicolor CBS 583.65]|uniref:SAP domain-containing protein n=1 Tax=Aspergillus versicolor CBS 583.65 TaxID=1036611 RepID=A0A1L9PC76_ASPVE|nr:uncharacterized protein ASPVEDRAFT_125467 [Aspergillus versicolor CBS 583.65]OJI99054.1 hypothetical protein ASPVEDRAFT_125467 [Aspergillus versicolor CBS 583.65]
MTDYSTWKVTDLKAELKRRGIPQTGLRVKQQIIDRLVEEDNKAQAGGASEATTAPESEPQEKAQAVEPEAPTAAEKTDSVNDAPAQETAPTAPEDAEKIKSVNEKQAEEPPAQPDDSAAPPEPSQAEEPSKEAQETQAPDTQTKVGGEEAEADATTKSVELAPGGVAEAEPLSVTQHEAKPAEAEKAAPGAQTSEVNTALSTPLPTEELIDDVRKRKRRSQSPAPSLDEIARKKAKALGHDEAQALPEEKDATTGKSADGAAEPPQTHDETQAKKGTPQKHDMRFKGLFSSTVREQTRQSPPPVDTEMEDVTVEPALHAATSALYIDGLMRPLQPGALKNHLLSVATPAGRSPNPDLITDFYLDSIKTHCFTRFVDVSTASRARSALHGTIWPNEKNRKSLFVDFIPEHKVRDWIQTEEETRGGRGPPPRWEVKYDKRDDEVEAVLEQVDLKNAGSHAPRGAEPKEFSHPPPRGPRADMQPTDRRPSGPSQPSGSSRPGQGFKPLDELFKSTTAKPKLYYLPVPREVADRRLDRFDDLIRKGSFPRRGGDETRKFTFEDDDRFVDSGPEFAGRGRGPGGRGRGRGGGMFDSRRGGRRDQY